MISRRLTDQLVKTAIHAGASAIAVHGRNRFQSSDSCPVSLEDIRFANDAANGAVPVIANGDVFTLEDAQHTRSVCGVNGVMSARGLLANPALFAGATSTPDPAIQVGISL